MNMPKTFENYLMEIHAKGYHGTDDEMIDNFNVWIERLDAGEILQYAEDAVAELNAKFNKSLSLADEAITELQKIKEMITSLPQLANKK